MVHCVNLQHIDLSTSPTYCCYTTLGNMVVLGKTVRQAPAHSASRTIELLQRETPKFLRTSSLRIVLTLVLLIYYWIWGVAQDRVSDASSRRDRFIAHMT